MIQNPTLATEAPVSNPPATWQVLRRIAEVMLLIPAFGLLIPPIPSHPRMHYSLMPTLPMAAACLAASLFLALRRGGEHWAIAALKLVLFRGLGWLITARVNMTP